MNFFKMIRLGLLHVAVGVTFVAINGVLNRVMIHELNILTTVVALLVILPYVFSPAQVWIGQYSDTHPVWGYRRTPYILLGILLCVGGMVMTPHAALLIARHTASGIAFALVAFMMWGVGYNMAVVSYLSLASDLSSEQQRSRTISVMWFMMIAGLIVTSVFMGRQLEPYSEAQLIRVFNAAGVAVILLALAGLAGMEPRNTEHIAQSRESQVEALRAVAANPHARIFFLYLVLLLAAILGQDILLEPFGAHAFDMTVEQTTQLTGIWGGMTLLSLLLFGFVLTRWMTKKQGAYLGGIIAVTGLMLIASSGAYGITALFYTGVAVLGFGTGIATTTNLSLMLDMTTSEQAGLFIGAWGLADALSRGLGAVTGGIVRDTVTALSANVTAGYVTVFMIEAGFLLTALLLLRHINVVRFRDWRPTITEMTALASD